MASDVMETSGQQMLRAIIDGETNAECLAKMARRRMRSKIPELCLGFRVEVADAPQWVRAPTTHASSSI